MKRVDRVVWDIETTGLNPRYTGYVPNRVMKQEPRITCISWMINGETEQIAGDDEDMIITEFLTIIRNVKDFSRIFSYNGYGFDSYYLTARIEENTPDKKDLEICYKILKRPVWRDLLKISDFNDKTQTKYKDDMWIGKIMKAEEVAIYYGISYKVPYTGKRCLRFAFNKEYGKIMKHCEGDIKLLDMIIDAICEERGIDWWLL